MLSRPTTLFGILLAALSPLIGILYFGWDWRSTLIFYWLFNVTFGAAVVIGIIRARTAASLTDMIRIARVSHSVLGLLSDTDASSRARKFAVIKMLVILFFCLHYGLFTLVHGVFVLAITARDNTVSGLAAIVSSQPANIREIVMLWSLVSAVQLVGLFRDDKSRLTINGAYARIATLHFSIIIGLFLIVLLDWPAVAAVLLVAISLVHDLVQYRHAGKSLQPEVLT